MRILVLTDRDWINANYRSFCFAALRSRGHAVRVVIQVELLRLDPDERYDVVHVYRLNEATTRAIVKSQRERGAAIVWDDDDHTAEPALNQNAMKAQRARAEVTRMLELADIATAPSTALAEQYHSWGAKQVRVIENYVPGTYEVPASPPRSADEVTIGWTAAVEHLYDLEHLGVTDTLRRLLAAHPKLRVTSIGIDLRLPQQRYRHITRVQFHDLAATVAGFDIGIAPLADITFNRARSNSKLKEYAFAGVPWLASPIGPYAGFEAKQGGYLVPDGGWDRALTRLIEKPRERRKLAKRGRRWAEGQTVMRNLDRLETLLSDAVACARAA